MAKGNVGRRPVWHAGVLRPQSQVGQGPGGMHGRRPAVPFAEGDAGTARVFE